MALDQHRPEGLTPDNTELTDELTRCSRCGYCMAVCPTYEVTRDERMVARGRNELVRRVNDGRMDLLKQLRDPLFECLLCGACTQACFGRVKTDEIMVQAREAWHREHGQPLVQRMIFDHLLPYPDRMARLLRLLGTGERSGLSELAARLGVLRWVSPALHEAQSLSANAPREFLRDILPILGFAKRQLEDGSPIWVRPRDQNALADGPAVAYFIGCGTNYRMPWQGEATLRLLACAGCEITIVENVCCGLPPYAYGDLDAAGSLAARNVELLGQVEVDYITTECGSCSAFLKKWPDVIRSSETRSSAEQISGSVMDATELLATLQLPAPARATGATVAYHDPCHLVRGQGIRDEPRRLLVDHAGLVLHEMQESDWCCGGAGSYNLTHPELSRAILERKLARFGESGADLLATACPACVTQLGAGARSASTRGPVQHVMELVCEGLGIPLHCRVPEG